MQDYSSHDAIGLATLVQRGAVSASELVAAAIERIERLDGRINAVVHCAFEEARAAAAGPLPDGPFAGVPFSSRTSASAWRAGRRRAGAGSAPISSTPTTAG
ncbi:hypothetical protein AB5I41_07445 [Sphingomonas sp. MMS24-JH45]